MVKVSQKELKEVHQGYSTLGKRSKINSGTAELKISKKEEPKKDEKEEKEFLKISHFGKGRDVL